MILNSHNDCFNLIELYYDQIVNNQSGQSLVIRFEDILSNPKLEVMSLLEYCKISVDSDKLNQILSKIDSSRKYAYKKETSLVEAESKVFKPTTSLSGSPSRLAPIFWANSFKEIPETRDTKN